MRKVLSVHMNIGNQVMNKIESTAQMNDITQSIFIKVMEDIIDKIFYPIRYNKDLKHSEEQTHCYFMAIASGVISNSIFFGIGTLDKLKINMIFEDIKESVFKCYDEIVLIGEDDKNE